MAAMMRIALAALLLVLAPALFAVEITFVPPNPTPHASVDAVVRGSASLCGPLRLESTVAGSTITLRRVVEPFDGGCAGAFFPYTSVFHLGVLPAMPFVVIATEGLADQQREIARTTLLVRDDETLRLQPYAVSTDGGSVRMDNPFKSAVVKVTVGGSDVPFTTTGSVIRFDAPPHAAGGYDVSVWSVSDALSARFALIYYDPGSVAPEVFEPLLFPLSYEGAGAFGSLWTTDNLISGSGIGTATFRDPLPCEGCTNVFSEGTKRLTTNNQPWGRVLYALRGTTGKGIVFQSRARDVSRAAESAGVEIPVVRERDFREGPVQLVNVPSDTRFRAMLRIWTMNDLGAVIVSVGSTFMTLPTTRIPGTAIFFASAEITSRLRTGGTVTIDLGGSLPSPSIFAMISVTNNETQEVTIVSSR